MILESSTLCSRGRLARSLGAMKRKRSADARSRTAKNIIAVLPTPPSSADFYEIHVRRSVPAVIRGAVQDWPALERWQRSGYFADAAPASFRESQITVAAAPDAVYSGDPKQQDSIMMKWCAQSHDTARISISNSTITASRTFQLVWRRLHWQDLIHRISRRVASPRPRKCAFYKRHGTALLSRTDTDRRRLIFSLLRARLRLERQ